MKGKHSVIKSKLKYHCKFITIIQTNKYRRKNYSTVIKLSFSALSVQTIPLFILEFGLVKLLLRHLIFAYPTLVLFGWNILLRTAIFLFVFLSFFLFLFHDFFILINNTGYPKSSQVVM